MSLVLDLLRHGHALPAGDGGDALRPLSPRGRDELQRLAEALRHTGWRPERAFTSPLLRALESARVALGGAAPHLEPEPMEALLPDADPGRVIAALHAEGADQGHVLLVGHQPLMGLLAAFLTRTPAPDFPTACLLRLEFASGPLPGTGRPGLRIAPG